MVQGPVTPPPPQVEDVPSEQLDQLTQTRGDAGTRPRPVQVGVRLQQVQLGVHRFRRIHVDVAEAEVRRCRPVLGPRLDVPPIAHVVRVPFDELVHLAGGIERTILTGRQVVFTQRVDAERLAVDLLRSLQRPAVRSDPPQVPAVLAITEARLHRHVRAPRKLEVARIRLPPAQSAGANA